MDVELVREILAAHRSGISRAGLLAWARLRGNPQMTDAELEAALAAMGDDVVDVQGFLYLRDALPAGPDAGSPPQPWPSPTAPGEPPSAAVIDTPAWASALTSAADDGASWVPPEDATSAGRRTMVVAAVAVGILVAIALAVALALRAEDGAGAAPTPSTGTVIDASDLTVGACIILPAEDQFDDVRQLSCAEPHDGEVFFVGRHPEGDYPPDEAFEGFVDEHCLPAFATYTGSNFYEQEVLQMGWFTPTEGSWEGGDRDVTCHLTPVDGSRTDRSWRNGTP
jgi:hypothetical protein